MSRAEVAKLAGVSPAVVSYVIHNGPRPVASATRARVRAAIDELGYRPHPIAQALRGQPTKSVGLLIPDEGANPFFSSLYQAVEEAAFRRGFVVLMGNSMNSAEREREYLTNFTERKVDAVIVIPVEGSLITSEVAQAEMPVLALDRVADPGIATVMSDNRRGAFDATTHLLGHGYDSVGCIAGPQAIGGGQDRVEGWREGLESAGVKPDADWLQAERFTMAGGLAAARKLLAAEHRPRAIFASADVQAIGAIRACAELGLRVPDDVAIVSFDGSDACEFSTPPLTSVTQSVAEMAEVAIARLLGEASSEPGEQVTIPTELVLRRSCGCDEG